MRSLWTAQEICACRYCQPSAGLLFDSKFKESGRHFIFFLYEGTYFLVCELLSVASHGMVVLPAVTVRMLFSSTRNFIGKWFSRPRSMCMFGNLITPPKRTTCCKSFSQEINLNRLNFSCVKHSVAQTRVYFILFYFSLTLNNENHFSLKYFNVTLVNVQKCNDAPLRSWTELCCHMPLLALLPLKARIAVACTHTIHIH